MIGGGELFGEGGDFFFRAATADDGVAEADEVFGKGAAAAAGDAGDEDGFRGGHLIQSGDGGWNGLLLHPAPLTLALSPLRGEGIRVCAISCSGVVDATAD